MNHLQTHSKITITHDSVEQQSKTPITSQTQMRNQERKMSEKAQFVFMTPVHSKTVVNRTVQQHEEMIQGGDDTGNPCAGVDVSR